MQPNTCAIRKIKDDMTEKGGSGNGEPPSNRQRNERLPPEILEIIKPALQVGGLSGMSGLIVGGFAGVVRSSTPVIFALTLGIHWFTVGTTLWASRGVIFHAWGKDKVTPRDKVTASAIAGGVGGTAGGLLRGQRNVIPAAVLFALVGAGGQMFYNAADAQRSAATAAPEKDLRNSWLNSKWSPMQVLSDEEYEDMLRERLLKVDAEIALVDESIAALRVREQGQAAEEIVGKRRGDR